jgi:hypothetical protein
MYIMHSCPLSYIYEQLLLKPHFQNPHFKVKNIFEPNVFKFQILWPFLSSMLKFSPIFKRNGAHLVEKRRFKKTKTFHS